MINPKYYTKINNKINDIDQSKIILKGLDTYLSLFQIQKSYYIDVYGIYLKEIKNPRIISIFHFFNEERFELRSEILKENDHMELIYFQRDILDLKTLLKLTRMIILGYDRISFLINYIHKKG